MGKLYTIGHSQHEIEYFLEMLNKYNINYVLDVRSTPYSKYAEQYNKENIEKYINNRKIKYCFMGKVFGARPNERELYAVEGYLDFEKVRKTKRFIKGFNSVVLGLQRKNNIALMCTEKDPFDCHRAIMIARAFELKGIGVNHIMADGNIQSQEMLDDRLLNKYCPDWRQRNLSDYINNVIKDREDYLREAYRKRNKEIGYHLQDK